MGSTTITTTPSIGAFWHSTPDDLVAGLDTSLQGLTSAAAQGRLASYGPNLLQARRRTSSFGLLVGQFKSPIILILVGASILSVFLRDTVDAAIILVIVAVSRLLGFWQERGAAGAVEKLLALVQVEADVLRDGKPAAIPVEAVVPGDVALLSAGDIVPGDCLILESNELFTDEATLTGETFPAEKQVAVLPEDTPLAKRTNSLFMGTHVVSGSARALVVRTGTSTEFGRVSESLSKRADQTDFEHGVSHFGYLLLEITLILVLAIFAINVYLHRPVLDSLLFSMALAVGLTPQLLPAIISINLSHGAKRMAEEQVIVKRLAAIENLGSMSVLCSDKTGTMTEGKIRLHAALGLAGNDSERVLFFAYLNAAYETGFHNPIDEAIRTFREFDISALRKLDEVPYDFVRKRLSILVGQGDRHIFISKGTLTDVLQVCSTAESEPAAAAGTQPARPVALPRLEGSAAPVPIETVRAQIETRFAELSGQGYRVLGLAYRDVGPLTDVTRDDERDMTFLGFLVFADPPKADIDQTLLDLKALGVSVKMITGDNPLVAASVGRAIGLPAEQVLTGQDVQRLSDEALRQRVAAVDIFAEIEPNQKERLIIALRKTGAVVGYMGDGINDASALHAADVGISVNTAVDVAKEAADFVLLQQDLAVLARGVREGRRTFANTLKYVYMATSANFGNMFSMAGASLFLPFLPLLPKQILLTNLLTDFPEMTIATDGVDPEMVAFPRRWDIHEIRSFMMVFGLLSSIFDYATFGVLLWLLHANRAEFRTGWFMESVASASLIVLVIRTRRPFFRSAPSRRLLVATLLVVAVAIAIPLTPLGDVLGFTHVPLVFFPALAGILLCYAASAEIAKWLFYHTRKAHAA